MKNLSLVVLALATALATVPAAKADTFTFTATGIVPGDSAGTSGVGLASASGTLVGNPIAGQPGVFDIVSGTATIFLDGNTYTGSIISNPLTGQGNSIDNPFFNYADALTTSGSPEIVNEFDTNTSTFDGGLLFTVGPSTDVDLWYSVAGTTPGYTIALGSDSGYDPSFVQDGYDVSFSAQDTTVTPEPSSWLLLGTGLLFLGGFLYRKAKPGLMQAV